MYISAYNINRLTPTVFINYPDQHEHYKWYMDGNDYYHYGLQILWIIITVVVAIHLMGQLN